MDIYAEIEKVNQKQKKTSENLIKSIQRIKNVLETTNNQLQEDGSNIVSIYDKLEKEGKEVSSIINNEQKDFYSSFNKFGKLLDKKFKIDLSLACNPNAFDGKEHIFKKIIVQHLIREGHFEIAHSFSQEADIEFPDDLKDKFEGMYSILNSIKNKDLQPAINWAKENQASLETNGSQLGFLLHKLQYVNLLQNESDMKALTYAKESFGPYLNKFPADIQRLMGFLTFSKKRNMFDCPYSDFLNPNYWIDIQHTFTKDYCYLLGFSHESPLYISLTVGTSALPILVKVFTIMKEKRNEWSQQGELPVEIHLTDHTRFHSIFVCPVSKEQATTENPPMLMPCGHSICLESLNKLSKGVNRFKCPYCPGESLPSQAQKVYL